MDAQYRDLHQQIMNAVTETEGEPLPLFDPLVLKVRNVAPEEPGMQAIQGTHIPKGLHHVKIQSGVYLVKTIHRRGEKQVAIYNICVMDAAGAVRLLIDTRQDARTPNFAQNLRTPLTNLIDEHARLNNHGPPPFDPTLTRIQALAATIMDLPPELWAEWVTQLLEELKKGTDLHTYSLFLEEVQRAIDAWLLTGLW